MTVIELIKKLSGFPNNMEVITKDDMGFHHKPALYEDDYDEFGVVLVIAIGDKIV